LQNGCRMTSDSKPRVATDALRLSVAAFLIAAILFAWFKWQSSVFNLVEQHVGLIAAVTLVGVLIQIKIANRQLDLARSELKLVEEDLQNSRTVTDLALKQYADSEKRAKLRLSSSEARAIQGANSIIVTLHNDGNRTATALNLYIFFAVGITNAEMTFSHEQNVTRHIFKPGRSIQERLTLPIRELYIFPNAPLMFLKIDFYVDGVIPSPAIYWRAAYEDGITPPFNEEPIILF